MLKFDESIVVNGSAEAVFQFVSNPLNIPRYQAEVVSTRLMGEGPLRVGAKFEERMRMPFGEQVFDCSVVTLEPSRRVAFTAAGRPLECRVEMQLEPVDGALRLRMFGSGELRGAWKLLTPMMRMQVAKGARAQLLNIKAEVEGKKVPGSHAAPVVALVLLAALGLGGGARAAEPQPSPELARTVEAFTGNWTYEGTVTVGAEAPKKAKVTMSCRPTARAKAVTCAFSAAIAGEAPYEAGVLVGYDTFGKKVHFMAITSDEEVHDHACAWSGKTTLACESYKGGMLGDEVTEELSFTLSGDAGGFKSTLLLKDGTKLAFDVSGRRKKG